MGAKIWLGSHARHMECEYAFVACVMPLVAQYTLIPEARRACMSQLHEVAECARLNAMGCIHLGIFKAHLSNAASFISTYYENDMLQNLRITLKICCVYRCRNRRVCPLNAR